VNNATRRALLRFGLRLAELREERGLTQEQLAELIDMSARQLQRAEAGEANVNLLTLIALGSALRCDVAELFARGSGVDRRRPGRPRRA
jgi:transcriptional regulator with XRE-family HTH domain